MQIGRQVKTVRGEDDVCAYFAGKVRLVAKPLHLQDKHLRKFLKLETFLGAYQTAASFTAITILPLKSLGSTEGRKTGLQLDGLSIEPDTFAECIEKIAYIGQ